MRHGSSTRTLTPLAVATILYNDVDSPVGVIPVTHVDATLDALTAEWRKPNPVSVPTVNGSSTRTEGSEMDTLPSPHPSGPRGSPMVEETLYDGSMGEPKAYDPEVMEGLPVGIQMVGQLNQDEKIVGIMGLIDGLLDERGFGPGKTSVKYSR